MKSASLEDRHRARVFVEGQTLKKILLLVGALIVAGAAVGGGAVLRLPGPGHHIGRYGAQLSSFLVGASRHDNHGIERGLQERRGRCARSAAALAERTAADWPSYNRTLTSERYSQLSEINTKNAGKLKVLCTYDVDDYTAFESGLIMVDNALIGTTEFDIFSLDPATCAENWRTHEDYPPALLPSNRGAAYLDGMLFRGTQDGRVLAYDFKTGKRLWETTIADPKRGELVPSAPIACRRSRLRRQCGRRLQRREGPHVRARRQDRQDRLGVLSGSQGRGRHRPRTAGRDAARRIEVEELRRASRSAAAEPGRPTHSTRKPGCSTCPAAIQPPIS